LAKYKSKFKSLGFYVGGERFKFLNGEYETTTKKQTDVLDKLPGVEKLEETKGVSDNKKA
jgi:hypothetical protein